MPGQALRPEIMLIKHHSSKKTVRLMDPDCAICSQPALAQCECEAKGLDIAVRQAEQRMMTSVFNDIRYFPFSSPIPSFQELLADEVGWNKSLGAWPRPRLHSLILQHAHLPAQRRTHSTNSSHN